VYQNLKLVSLRILMALSEYMKGIFKAPDYINNVWVMECTLVKTLEL